MSSWRQQEINLGNCRFALKIKVLVFYFSALGPHCYRHHSYRQKTFGIDGPEKKPHLLTLLLIAIKAERGRIKSDKIWKWKVEGRAISDYFYCFHSTCNSISSYQQISASNFCRFLNQFKLLASVVSCGDEVWSWAGRASCRWYQIFDLLIAAECSGAAEDSRHAALAGTPAICASSPASCHSNGRRLGQSCDADRGTLTFLFRGSHLTIPLWRLLGFCVKVQVSSWIILWWFLGSLFLEHCCWFQHFITRETLMNYSK